MHKVILQDPIHPVDWFQRGENAAIALAIEQQYFLLMDDANPYHVETFGGSNELRQTIIELEGGE